MSPPRRSALTLTEVLVGLAIIGVVVFIAVPLLSPLTIRRGPPQILNNMRQLHLATMQMALDGESTGDQALGWPGDTGDTFSYWANRLVEGGYLSTNDFCKLLSAPGIVVKRGRIPAMRDTALLVYAVSTNSPENGVFLSSANFTNTPAGGLPLQRSSKPYGIKGFVVVRKAGGGAILLREQVGNTNLIGSFVPLLK